MTILKAQEKERDTIFFSIDKYYTISPTITPNLTNKTYLEIVEFQKQLMSYTKTNGYIYFIGDGILTKGLKPKKVLSIKDYVENRKFYLDGKYNKIIDDGKLKDSLTDKYKIFFVNGDEFISPRVLEYYSYYPIREGDKVIQNKIKDTLFFKLDNDYVYESKYAPKVYLINENIESSEVFSLRELEKINSLKSKKILSFRDYVKSSRFYNENRTTKLNKIYFMKYLEDYIIFLVNNKNEYIKVEPSVIIED
ncbi:hypothetical protein AR687_15800 [Flavobacteriaceae bacterium CRH]|nr:hypothetical protein AR687_15800 [Flavobacteriaceae bacterium CRH]